jgi:hypothetical protein
MRLAKSEGDEAMRTGLPIVPLSMLALGACASTGKPVDAGAATCRIDAASTLIGRPVPGDSEILARTGGSVVRRIAPGDATTKDFRNERVTVTITGGRVVSASCG